MASTNNLQEKPPFRKLRGYAFDPAVALQMDTAPISTITYKVPWEDDVKKIIKGKKKNQNTGLNEGLRPGPIGEYLEVIDYDPTVKKFYKPVDLNDPYLLAQDGLEPSEGNPQFHQQMVYAVAMTTIKNFERALGRQILWADRWNNGVKENVPRLRIYPHALREANAYYSPHKKALLFGYFSSSPANESIQMPASLVFTCLSHDIIAHETTHAILDGMHQNFNEPTNPDVLAFHEAFSDIVALFQHFTFPDVLKSQIRKTRGDLAAQNLLGQLAQQFGAAIGRYGSLREAIGEIDETGQWQPKKPNPEDYRTVMEPHGRGSILVAAVFEAFINIYKSRVADLIRIASNGTGILRQGEIPADLINRLADEAAKAADHVLQMCIRALDYCPPVDINFGDYLRAIITADMDLVADDSRNYRLAFIDAFRRRGIYPKDLKTLSIESLRLAVFPHQNSGVSELFRLLSAFLRQYRNQVMDTKSRHEIYAITRNFITGDKGKDKRNSDNGLHSKILKKLGADKQLDFEKLTGLVLGKGWQDVGVNGSGTYKDFPAVEIQNLRLVSRVGPQGMQVNQIIFSLIQQASVPMKEGVFSGFSREARKGHDEDFTFRAGCTLIFDLNTLQLQYAVTKPLLNMETLSSDKKEIDKRRLEQQYRYWHNEEMMCMTDYNHYFGGSLREEALEPFAFLHNH